MRRIARFFLLLAGLTLVVNGCTTRPIVVPSVDYAQASQDEDALYRIRTTEGRKYDVRRFVVTDSTLTILELRGTPRESSMFEPGYYPGVELPLELPIDQIASIEHPGEPSDTRRVAGAAVEVVVVMGVIIAVAVAWALSRIDLGTSN